MSFGNSPQIPASLNLGNVSFAEPASLRESWQRVLETHGQYACFAFFLLLPSDQDAIRYLTEYGRELDLVSGDDCLVLVQTKRDVVFGAAMFLHLLPAVIENASSGYSLKTADYFDIGADEFPCLVLFQDIHSTEHVLVSFAGLDQEQIAGKIRSVFTVIHRAVEAKTNPLEALARQNKTLGVSAIRSVRNRTFGGAMDEATLEPGLIQKILHLFRRSKP